MENNNLLKSNTISVLKGFGQVMLQDNAWTGLLFLVAICYDSWLMGSIALLSAIIGTLTAKALKFNENNIRNGLYGFNAVLTGLALVFYFQLNWLVWLAIIIGAVLSTLLMELAIRKNMPAFTFPFIFITWILIYGLNISGLVLHNTPDSFINIAALNDFALEGHAFGEVLFQGSVIAGLIFFVGVFVNSPISALYGFAATILSVAISHYGHEPAQQISDGIFSFNAVLCGIACSGLKPRDGLYVLLAVLIATFLDMFMIAIGLTTLTFPFVFAMWIILLIKGLVAKLGRKTTDLSIDISSPKGY